ncbi:MAG: hypothetical protein IIC67_08980 [Thaumarchaeota archaeon]|nr:hypothetical protein [Nitrososphaerota archaeon]
MSQENQAGRPREYRNSIMRLFAENKTLSINDMIDKLPTTQRKCKSCGGNASIICGKCIDGKSKPLYYVIFREVKILESENYLEQVEEITQQGKPELKYDLTTNGIKLIIDSDQTLDITKFGNMLLSRASQENFYKFKLKSSKKESKPILLEKSKRNIGFNLTDAVKYYESKILNISREFVFPQNVQKNINELQYFTEEDFSFLGKSLPILNNLCKKPFLNFKSIYESVKSDFTLPQFNKIFSKLATMELLMTYSKNNMDFFSLSFTGLMVFHHIVESNNASSLNVIKKYGTTILPRLFSNKIFEKLLSSKKEKSDLISIMFELYFYDKSIVLRPLNENQDACLRLLNAQETIMSTYRCKISALYIQLLSISEFKMKEDFENFMLVESGTIHPRIHPIFRDLYYSEQQSIRNDYDESNDSGTFEELQKIVLKHKINLEHFITIYTDYRELIRELLTLDELIYGDDVIRKSNYLQSKNELVTKIVKTQTVFEFRSWIFLKFSYPEICNSVMKNNIELLTWWNAWRNEIIQFEKQNVSSLEQMINQEVSQ